MIGVVEENQAKDYADPLSTKKTRGHLQSHQRIAHKSRDGATSLLSRESEGMRNGFNHKNPRIPN